MKSDAELRAWENKYRAVSQAIAHQILEVLPEGGTLIDIGANVGVVTEEVLQKRPCTAYLFEPVPDYYEFCRRKFDGRATMEPYALGEARGQGTLWLDPDNWGWNTLVAEKKTAGMEAMSVDIVSFDDYAEQHLLGRIDAIKIDVEGYEYQVFQGMQRTLSRVKPVIFCEIGWGKAHPHWAEEVEALEWLFANGYQRFDYHLAGTTDVVISPVRPS